MNEQKQKSDKCCFKDCNSLAETLSNYCSKHRVSNYKFHSKHAEMLTGSFSIEEITEKLIYEKLGRFKNQYIDRRE